MSETKPAMDVRSAKPAPDARNMPPAPDARNMPPAMDPRYLDMLDMERPVSLRHPPMPLLNRAAQFMPFAALTGYEDVISETAQQNLQLLMEEEAGIPVEETLESDYLAREGE